MEGGESDEEDEYQQVGPDGEVIEEIESVQEPVSVTHDEEREIKEEEDKSVEMKP